MAQAFIDELKKENLCTHFVLPLLKLNKFSFIVSNFANSYLSSDRQLIIVHVMDLNLLSRRLFIHPQYRGVRVRAESPGFYLLYSIPVKWRNDLELFAQGKFSHMSKAAKDTIIRFSELPYHETLDGRTVSDGRLLALERHKIVRTMWERELSSDDRRGTGRITLAPDEELLSIPGKDSYLDPTVLKNTKEAQL